MERKMWRNGSWNKNAAELMVHSQSYWSPSSRRKIRKKREKRRRSGSEREGGRMTGVGWDGVSERKERRSRQWRGQLWASVCLQVREEESGSFYTVFMWNTRKDKRSFNRPPVRFSPRCGRRGVPGQVTSVSQGDTWRQTNGADQL